MEKHLLILTTTHDFLWKFERENVRLLQQMGYTVHYATNLQEPAYMSDDDHFQRMGIQVHPLSIARSPFRLGDNLRALRQLLDLIRQYDIRAIHCHTPVGGVLGRLAGQLSSKPRPVVLYTAHGFHFYRGAPLWNRLFYYPVERALARYTDILIVINEEDYQSAQRLRLKKGGRVYRIPGAGLDRERFQPLSAEHKQAARRQLQFGPADFFLLSVGELNDNKNHTLVLDALAQMKRAGDDLSTLHYGICGDGFLHEELQRKIQEAGLENTVTLYGYCSRVPDILGCADASAFPSKREGLGMAGLESLAMGVPVLAADNRGTREYMRHGQNGLVCPPDDVDSWIAGIRTLRQLAPASRETMQTCCRASVKPFDKTLVRTAMRHIYQEMDQRIQRREQATRAIHHKTKKGRNLHES